MPQQPATSFADDLQKARGDFASDLAAAQQHVNDKQDVPHPIVQRLLGWLPAIGGMIGEIGGPGGAGLGGASGEAFSQLGNRMAGNPAPATSADAAKSIGEQAVAQAVGSGLVTAAAPAAKAALGAAAPWLMTKAVKPAAALLEDFRTTAPALAKTLLDEGVNVTRGGVDKLTSLLTATRSDLRQALAEATTPIEKTTIAAEVAPTALKIARQPNPTSDLEAVGNQVEGFLQNHPLYQGSTMSPLETQDFKVGTYDKLANSYGERSSAAVEADKAMARGAKNQINAAVPTAAASNERDAALTVARQAVAKQVGLAANRDPVGLTWIAHNPTTAMSWLLEKSPAVKSLIARGMYAAAGSSSGVPTFLVKAIVHGVAGLPSEINDGSQP